MWFELMIEIIIGDQKTEVGFEGTVHHLLISEHVSIPKTDRQWNSPLLIPWTI
ncbi:hypothetical protein LguiA_024254 [Lonicera macranthoides]